MKNNNLANEFENMDYVPTKIQRLYTDEKGNDIYAYKCPQPYCNNFYSANENSQAKSCGCLRIENARRIGKANKKTNSFYFPLNYKFGVCFYDNHNGYFIFDIEDFDLVVHCKSERNSGAFKTAFQLQLLLQ